MINDSTNEYEGMRNSLSEDAKKEGRITRFLGQARLQLDRKSYDEARKHIRKALALDPAHEEAKELMERAARAEEESLQAHKGAISEGEAKRKEKEKAIKAAELRKKQQEEALKKLETQTPVPPPQETPAPIALPTPKPEPAVTYGPEDEQARINAAAEEAKRKVREEAQRRMSEEETRRRAEEEIKIKAAEEKARRKAIEDAKRELAEERARRKLEEEARRREEAEKIKLNEQIRAHLKNAEGHLRNGHFDLARAEAERAASLDQGNSNVIEILGKVDAAEKAYVEEQKNFKRQEEERKKRKQIEEALEGAEGYIESKEFDRAKDEAMKAISIEGSRDQVDAFLRKVDLAEKAYKSDRERIKREEELHRKRLEIATHLKTARWHFKNHDYGEAKKEAEKAMAIDSADEMIQEFLLQVNKAEKEYTEEREKIKKEAEETKRAELLVRYLKDAREFLEQDKFGSARSELRKAYELDDHNTEVNQLLDQLSEKEKAYKQEQYRLQQEDEARKAAEEETKRKAEEDEKKRQEAERQEAERRAREEARLAEEAVLRQRQATERLEAERRAREEARIAEEAALRQKQEAEKQEAERKAQEEARLTEEAALRQKQATERLDAERRAQEEAHRAEEEALRKRQEAEKQEAEKKRQEAEKISTVSISNIQKKPEEEKIAAATSSITSAQGKAEEEARRKAEEEIKKKAEEAIRQQKAAQETPADKKEEVKVPTMKKEATGLAKLGLKKTLSGAAGKKLGGFKLKKMYIWITAGLLIIAFILSHTIGKMKEVFFKGPQEEGKETVEFAETIPVKVYKVKRMDFRDTLPVLGRIEGFKEIELRFADSGIIESFNFEEGERILEGDIITSLDQKDALLKLKYAGLELEKSQRLLKLGGTDKMAVEQKQLEYESAKRDLEKTNIYSSGDGYLGSKEKDAGSYITPQDKVGIFVDFSEVYAAFDVIEEDSPKMELGQTAEIFLDAYPGVTYDGTVDMVSPMIEGRTRTQKVKIELDNADSELKPGMFARAIINTYEQKDALIIPASAFKKQENRYYVYVVHPDEPEEVVEEEGEEVSDDQLGVVEEREIEIEYLTHDAAEVGKGLEEGELIIRELHQEYKDKDKVEITEVQETIF